MDNLIRNRNAKLEAFQQEIDTLKQTLSNHVKEKESLSTTLTVFKIESKEKESKYIGKEIVLEKQNKELENILCKLYRSTQAMHILTKPQVFYDDTHKQALGYQNPFNLKKAQRIKPTLYDGSVIAKKHDVISVIDDEETLILEEESRSKMFDKQNDLISIKQKINISPIDYSKLNNLKEDFGKRFVTQKELSAEQAFWLKHSNSNSETSVKSHTPVRIEAPKELPKVSLVNESLKMLKYQLASFDKVVKKRTTSDAITVGAWGFEHTKACFLTEIIPFLMVLEDTFNAFDKTILDEITEVQTVFNQMEDAVDQCSVDKNTLEIQIKQLRIDNDQLLNQIMSQEIVHIAVNSIDLLDVSKSCVDECNKCLELETELLIKKYMIEKDVYEREHLKSIYKDQFDSIKKTRVRSKEHNDSLIAQINAKSIENSDLNAQLQEKVFAIAALKNQLRKLKGKNVVDTAVSTPTATTLALGMFKIDLEQKNKDAHIDYIKHSRDHADTLREIVKNARALSHLDSNLDSALPLKETTIAPVITPTSKLKVVQIIMRYLDFGCSKHMTGNRSQLINFVSKFLGTVRFGNDHIAKIMGYWAIKWEMCTKRTLHKPKAEDSIQEKLYLLHMDLYAVETTCYTQNRSLIQKCHNKTPYELLHDRKPNLSYLHVFDALCYPTNDGEDLVKLKPKADIGIFVGYAPAKKAL
ncbi:retrovirus-related pol polyprotein from transposon TNT 1-94 [Tanacetum coccineum]|uniref:Retrovirus-related pol polyprotein from transposon TNT 1-94 n=1 Tax=Tanacetum coccineum TaxID=301880 RepID=A0ABQ5I3P8_9ASTR